MSSASDTTRRRQQRVLYADRVVQETTFNKGLKNHIVLEGGNFGGAMRYPPYYNMVNGALETTPEERQLYINSVPDKTSTVVITVPGSPTGVSAVADNTEATITFTAPSSNGGSPILSYTVTSNPDDITVTGSASPITVTGLTNGTSYTFRVLATNAIGDSVPSSESNAVTPITIPDSPTGLIAVGGDTEATITFAIPSSNGGSVILSYTVTSSPDGITALGSTSPINVTGLTNGTPYTFTVVATNAAGDSLASDASNSVIPNIVLTRTVFTSGNGSWTAPTGVTSVDYLLVGGGGGGGGGSGTGAGGGGGAGSVKTGTMVVVPGSSYSYTVGTGGIGGAGSSGGESNGATGNNTVFDVLTANGGGLGYRSREKNSSNLFGAGGSAQSGDTATTGGSGGNVRDGTPGQSNGAGGGGGGAGGAGVTSPPNTGDNTRGGAGGAGIMSNLKDGTNQTYGVGGKGADEGTVGFIGAYPAGANGTANTGNGGGGGASNNLGNNGAPGGIGGSGIVVITYYV